MSTFSLQLVAAPAYLKRAGTPTHPEDLMHHACLHHKFPSVGKLEQWPLVSTDDSSEFQLPVTAVASTIEPLITMAEGGLGIACLPDFAVRKQLQDGVLVQVLPALPNITGRFRALWPSSRYYRPRCEPLSISWPRTWSLTSSEPPRERLASIHAVAMTA